MKFTRQMNKVLLAALICTVIIVLAGCTSPVAPETSPMESTLEPATQEPPKETQEPVVETPADPIETPAEPVESPEADLVPFEVTIDSQSGAGYEALQAKDVSELVTGTPWNESFAATTLPVYLNTALLNDSLTPTDELLVRMKEQLIDVAKRFGVTVDPNAIEEQIDESQGFPSSRVLYGDEKYSFETDMQVETVVRFVTPLELPEEHTHAGYATKEQLEALAEYLKETHPEWIGINDAVTIIRGGDYSIHGDQHYTLGFYEPATDEAQALANYTFRSINFHTDDAGKLLLIRQFNTDTTSKLGDYPIISPKEAKELLLSGKYFTTVPDNGPTEETVKAVSLIYRNSPVEKTFLPFYRFLVELSKEQDRDLTVYGAYYVPAVTEKYISNMPK